MRWGVNQYGDMISETFKTQGLTVEKSTNVSGTAEFQGLVMLQGGVQITYNDSTSIVVPSNKLTVKHNGTSYKLVDFIKGVSKGTIT